jgi:hypothetical protein
MKVTTAKYTILTFWHMPIEGIKDAELHFLDTTDWEEGWYLLLLYVVLLNLGFQKNQRHQLVTIERQNDKQLLIDVQHRRNAALPWTESSLDRE